MPSKKNDPEQYKIVLIGDSSVGKTTIINRLSTDEFTEKHISTIGVDFCFKCIEVDGIPMKLQIWDTAGQERFRSVSRSYYRGADGIIVVYAIDDTRSFQNVRKWLTEIDSGDRSGGSNTTPPTVKYLVGNKADLVEVRAITERAGKSEADGFGIKFMETSAKTSMNIENLFISIARDIRQKRPSSSKRSEPSIVINQDPQTESSCC